MDDLCAADPTLKKRIDQILKNKVYPLVRAAFANYDEDSPKGPLCVYDSIFVRYNGDQARALGRDGASQPLVSIFVWRTRFHNHLIPCSSLLSWNR